MRTTNPVLSAMKIAAEELLDRARKLRPIVEEQAAETERLTRISEDLHGKFEEAGFYRMLMPKRYGGLENRYADVREGVDGNSPRRPIGGGCGCLAANHSLQLGSWWPERAQDEIFGTRGDFKAASVAAPLSASPGVSMAAGS